MLHKLIQIQMDKNQFQERSKIDFYSCIIYVIFKSEQCI